MDRTRANLNLLMVLLLALVLSGGGGVIGGRATAATYLYEKDLHQIPSPVLAALNQLNRRTPPVLATTFEVDTKDGDQQIPDQYKVAVEAAKELPSLVVQAGQSVLKVVKDPKAEDVEAVR